MQFSYFVDTRLFDKQISHILVTRGRTHARETAHACEWNNK